MKEFGCFETKKKKNIIIYAMKLTWGALIIQRK